MLLIDERQNFINLPTPIGEMLAAARGLRLVVTRANQQLGQLSAEAEDIQHLSQYDMEATKQAIDATSVDLGEIDTRFHRLLTLMEAAPETYQQAPDQHRRVLTKFFFSNVYIKDDEIDFVLGEDLPDQMNADSARKRREAEAEQWEELVESLKNEEPDTRVASGSTINILVAGAGFEPATSGL